MVHLVLIRISPHFVAVSKNILGMMSTEYITHEYFTGG